MIKFLKRVYSLIITRIKDDTPDMRDKWPFETEVAFEVTDKAGVIHKFYRIINVEKMPPLRAINAQDIYNEMEWKIEREDLIGMYEANKILFNQGKLIEAYENEKAVFDRINHVCNIGQIYRLASVLYLSKDENPFDYDYSFNYRKIEFWQRHLKVEDFFLQSQLDNLVPFLNSKEIDLKKYTTEQIEERERNLTRIISVLLTQNTESALLTSLRLQRDGLAKWKRSIS